MTVERNDPAGDVEGLDEEFLHHLSRGTDRLSAGDVAGAHHALKRAAALRPQEVKALGLLGQACYRAGLLDEAAEAYGDLVERAPTEIVARVNLGLALLKAKRYADAIRHLQVAVELSPDHRKAMGYLGFAHLESGDPAGARNWFERAGSPAMVARCEEAMAQAAAGEAIPEPVVAAEAVTRETPTEPGMIPATPPATAPGAEPVAAVGLASYAEQRTIRPAREGFAVEGSVLHVPVHGEVVARLEGLFAARGTITARAEVKRYRGKPTEKPFGVARERLHRFTGEGALFYRTSGWVFSVVELVGDAGYFREESVFALEESLAWENGRVPSKHSHDLDLVHLQGSGKFLLRTAALPVALEVTGASPLRVPLAALVGWSGAVTPRVDMLGAAGLVDGPGLVVALLTGEGRVLVDPEAGLGE